MKKFRPLKLLTITRNGGEDIDRSLEKDPPETDSPETGPSLVTEKDPLETGPSLVTKEDPPETVPPKTGPSLITEKRQFPQDIPSSQRYRSRSPSRSSRGRSLTKSILLLSYLIRLLLLILLIKFITITITIGSLPNINANRTMRLRNSLPLSGEDFNLICIIRLHNNDLFIFNLRFSRFSNSSQEMHDLRNMMENLSQRFESLSDYRFGNDVARKLLS